MKSRASLIAIFLVLSLAICGSIATAEELTNDSRKTAVAVRITFSTRVMIMGHGREFSTQEPASGLSDVFVFSGGEVRRNGTFEVDWSPHMPIKSVEWLEVLSAEDQEAMEARSSCSRILSPGDSIQSLLSNAYDGLTICLEPGTYEIAGFAGINSDVTIIGLGESPAECQITCPDYKNLWLSPYQDGVLRLENVSFAIPKYSSGRIFAEDTAQCHFQNVEVLADSDFEIHATGQAIMKISNCVVFSINARERTQITVSDTRFDGALGTEYEFCGVSASQEAQITLSECTMSNYQYALNMEQESQLTMTSCSVTNQVRNFLDCKDFTGSITGTGNIVNAPLGSCEYLLPDGFLDVMSGRDD